MRFPVVSRGQNRLVEEPSPLPAAGSGVADAHVVQVLEPSFRSHRHGFAGRYAR
jgi:hypothetical protein